MPIQEPSLHKEQHDDTLRKVAAYRHIEGNICILPCFSYYLSLFISLFIHYADFVVDIKDDYRDELAKRQTSR